MWANNNRQHRQTKISHPQFTETSTALDHAQQEYMNSTVIGDLQEETSTPKVCI